MHLIICLSVISLASSKIAWKLKPEPVQIVNENESIQLNCEFIDTSNSDSSSSHFTIWYRDGASSNVLSLNDKLANLNVTRYEIKGKYNLVIKNVTQKDSGLYTCQLFQSSDLIASVNLTVLVPPKYIDLDIRSNLLDRSYYVENDEISLECCTNADANPVPSFTWHRVSRKSELITKTIRNTKYTMLSKDKICNYFKLNLTRQDNDHYFKCSVINRAIKRPINKNLFLAVEYKPHTNLHFVGNPSINRLSVIENTSVSLFCNATGLPNSIKYEWFFNDIRLDDFTNLKTLQLAQLKRHQAGEYTCRAQNKHGVSGASFSIEIIYAQITALNRTTSRAESLNLRQKNAIYINSVENSTVNLDCRLDTNDRQEIIWYYYQLNKNDQIVNRIKLTDHTKTSKNPRSGILTSISQIKLNKLRDRNSGYYSCGVRFKLTDSLKNSKIIEQNVTYYLQVQYSPVVTARKEHLYANNYDKIELACEVKSNPQSIISWYFKNREIQQSYKYKMTKSLIKKFDHSYLDDAENIHSFVSILTVSSLTHFDYGQYVCRSNNIIGGNSKVITLHQKHKPESPSNLQVTEVSANSIKLRWTAPPFTGENNTFVLNINRTFNLTMSDLTSDEPVKQVEIKGLHPERVYEFKILAFNSIGTSEFSNVVDARTLKTQLVKEELPELKLAQFNDIREAICFDLKPRHEEGLKGLIVKLEMNMASEYFDFNRTGRQSNSPKTYLISLNKLKNGQNCILFPQLVEIDQQREKLKNQPKLGQYQASYDLLMLNQTHKSNIYTLKSFNRDMSGVATSSNFGKSFFEFKNMNKLNISICFSNDTQVCTNKLAVNDYTSEFSMYITLIAVGCSIVLVLVILLIASICCCYCCSRRKQIKSQRSPGLKKSGVPLDQNLVIKSFPVIPGQRSLDYSDDSTKSSQEHILNGSNEICSHSSSSSGSQKYYQSNPNKVIDMYDPNVQNRYTYTQNQQNTSSIATVESDVSSSGNGSKSSSNHSPCTVLNDNNTTNFASISSSSYTNMSKSGAKPAPANPTTFLYNGTNYIKAYQTQTMTQQLKQMHHQFINSGNHDSPESGYSTPVNTSNNTGTMKKLVYEVIV